jgi:hypothetical protein
MKFAWDFEAVTYQGAVYCVECVPIGADILGGDVVPIFSLDEWTKPGATCDKCLRLHDYMSLIEE